MTAHLHARLTAVLRDTPARYPDDIATAVLAALLAGAEREPRTRLDDLTSDQLDDLYDDLDRYAHVLGEMNERAARAETERDQLRRERDGISRMHLTAMGDLGIALNRLDHIRDTCDRLRRASVLADGQPHTDRERGIVHAVDRVLAALDGPGAEEAATPSAPDPFSYEERERTGRNAGLVFPAATETTDTTKGN
ncbi:hypothetical protein ACWD25_04100 [Streptomyces sp. NPDC002920]